MKFKLIIISSLLIFIFSCKKESVNTSCEPQINNSYFPMTVGSYWVYQWYHLDLLEGDETIWEDKIDTILVEKDTLIGANTYAKIRDKNSFEIGANKTLYLRDSLGYIIDQKNNIYFSSSNFIDTLRIIGNNIRQIVYQMDVPNTPIETTAGIFNCLNFRGEVTISLPVNWSSPQYLNTYYSRGVGRIQENIFYSSSAERYHSQRRLIEYHLE